VRFHCSFREYTKRVFKDLKQFFILLHIQNKSMLSLLKPLKEKKILMAKNPKIHGKEKS
jgi:hypothetical protein